MGKRRKAEKKNRVFMKIYEVKRTPEMVKHAGTKYSMKLLPTWASVSKTKERFQKIRWSCGAELTDKSHGLWKRKPGTLFTARQEDMHGNGLISFFSCPLSTS